MNCPIERDLHQYLAGLDADARAFEAAAQLSQEPSFISRVVAEQGLYEVISGTGKEAGGLSSADQIALADNAYETIGLFLAGKASPSALIAALENCRPAFDQVIMNAAEDELS